MEDDVVDSLEKMKLTIEEEETIAISDDGRLEAIENCNLSLIGKFLTCKSFNKMAVKNTIRRAWESIINVPYVKQETIDKNIKKQKHNVSPLTYTTHIK